MNKDIARFLIKVVAFFIVWYLLYEMWLLPNGSLDEWLSLNIIEVSGGIFELFGFNVSYYDRVITVNQNPGIEVVNGCNGIAPIGLFIGFIVAYPGRIHNKLSFIIFGIAVIYLTNILRILTLTLTQDVWPSFFDIAHNYSTTAIFYLVIFLMWMLWVNMEDKGLSISEHVA